MRQKALAPAIKPADRATDLNIFGAVSSWGGEFVISKVRLCTRAAGRRLCELLLGNKRVLVERFRDLRSCE